VSNRSGCLRAPTMLARGKGHERNADSMCKNWPSKGKCLKVVARTSMRCAVLWVVPNLAVGQVFIAVDQAQCRVDTSDLIKIGFA
jgi:hypothetical protein